MFFRRWMLTGKGTTAAKRKKTLEKRRGGYLCTKSRRGEGDGILKEKEKRGVFWRKEKEQNLSWGKRGGSDRLEQNPQEDKKKANRGT